MSGKILLWLVGAIFTVYGIACLVSPELPAGYAGLVISNGDAYIEMAAMYGGLQTGFGLFCILCAINPGLRRAGLLMLVMCVGGLALTRLYTAWDTDWLATGYTWGALAFELTTMVLAIAALKKA